MSAEDEFRTLLAGNAGVAALVSQRVAQNAIRQGDAPPYVVFTSQHQPDLALDNTVLADQVTFTVQCWAKTALLADQVADAVTTCLASAGVVVTGRATGYDEELGLDATVLTVDWWD